ncbi:alpha/beta fold hydrolase [Saccharopolyspora sp. NPDC003752]
MATIVLVPGFWLGAWAWDDVTRELRELGHDVHAVTLPGLADRAAEAGPEVGVETHIADLVGLIEDNDLREVVLVGHSGGNVPVTGAADRVPDRVARVVYVDAGPMPSGMAVLDSNPPEVQEEWRKAVEAEGDGWRLPLPEFGVEDLAGLSDEQLARMRAMSTPQPFATATQPLRRPDAVPDVPISVIASTFTPEEVKALVDAGIPMFALLAGADLHHLPTGHWPMFSRPADLAAMLSDIAG